METVILTFIGEDKPGIIERIAKIIFLHNGSWQDSRFSHMAGQFAGFAKIAVPQKNTNALLDDLRDLSGLLIKVTQEDDENNSESKTAHLNIVGNDRPGIVQEVSQILAQLHVNVIEFKTFCDSAPNWGNPVFKAQIKVSIPLHLQTEALKEALEALGDDLILELE